MGWYLYGLLASVFLGIYNFLYGLLLRNLNASSILMGLGFGLIIVGLGVEISGTQPGPIISKSFFLPVLVGLVLGLGVLSVIRAFSDPQSQVSRLIPLINSNTLISVFLGLVLLGEYKTAPLLKVALGTLLILAGSIIIR